MKPLTKGGGLVDELIFEAYKNKHLDSSEKFRKEILKNYGFAPSYDLYARIISYQVKKFGSALTGSNHIERDKCIKDNNKNYREKRKRNWDRRTETKKFIERIENMNSNYQIEKDKILGCWVVWEVHPNYKVDSFHAKTKRECKEWVKKKVK